MLSSNSCKRWFKRPSISERTRKSPDRVGIRACLGDVETSKNDNRNRCALSGAGGWRLANNLGGRQRTLGESGVLVFSLRFRGGLHFSATPRQHLIWFGSPVRIDCRIAGRTLWHKAPAGSLAICPAGIDCGADAEASVDALVVAIDPGRLALAAAEASALEAQLNERLSGHDQVLLDLARFLASESARDYPNGPLYWNEVASGFTDSLGCVLFFPPLGKTDHRESRVPRVHVLDFLPQGSPYPLHDAVDHFFVGRVGANSPTQHVPSRPSEILGSRPQPALLSVTP
jgi:hypothetical protein